MKILKGGRLPFVKEMFMYSANTAVAPVTHTVGVFTMIAPPYASMVVEELLGQTRQDRFKDLTVSIRPAD